MLDGYNTINQRVNHIPAGITCNASSDEGSRLRNCQESTVLWRKKLGVLTWEVMGSHGKIMGNHGKSWEFHGKIMGNHGKSMGKSWEVGSDLWWFLGFHPWKMVGSWMEFGICWVNCHAENSPRRAFGSPLLPRVTTTSFYLWWSCNCHGGSPCWESKSFQSDIPRNRCWWPDVAFGRFWDISANSSNFQYKNMGHEASWSRGRRFTHLIPSGKHTKNYGKIHHFLWENSLFQWPFSIAMLVKTRG